MNIIPIIEALRERQGKTMLEDFRSKYTPFQILIATVMSARTKDSTTMPLAEKLFEKYKTAADFVRLPVEKLEKLIFPVGFYRTKARNIKKLCAILIEKFDGQVPSTLDELLTLPGVGRKTANCVLAYAFRVPAIPVDIHVHRISNRIGLVKTKIPEETEQELMKIVPRNKWLDVNELFVVHGQTICLPRTPKCGECPIQKWCDYGTHA
ncbi:MAG TPA: endonuclease III [Candidatus Nanoarchaeia archaeon]|nr:endonuclease III [Candidatus Nanoarchaeia archaeon]